MKSSAPGLSENADNPHPWYIWAREQMGIENDRSTDQAHGEPLPVVEAPRGLQSGRRYHLQADIQRAYHSSHEHEPSGTNLFGADPAEAMVRDMLEGLPPSPSKFLATEDGEFNGNAFDEERQLTDEEQAMVDGAWRSYQQAARHSVPR